MKPIDLIACVVLGYCIGRLSSGEYTSHTTRHALHRIATKERQHRWN